MQVAGAQVRVVDGGDLQLAAGAGLQVAGDLDDPVVVEVQAGDGVAGLGLGRLLLDGDDLAALVELDHAVRGRVGHRVGEDPAALDVRVLGQGGAEAAAVEDVVAEDEGHRLVADEVRAEHEGLGDALGLLLDGVLELQAELGTVTQQPFELVPVVRGGDDQDFTYPGHHQGREGVVDHRLVEDREELLRHRSGQGPQP